MIVMEDKRANPVLIAVCLSLAVYCYMLKSECKVYVDSLGKVDAGFVEFMNREVKGKPLYTYVNANSVGTFKIGKQSFACAELVTDLPVVPTAHRPSKD